MKALKGLRELLVFLYLLISVFLVWTTASGDRFWVVFVGVVLLIPWTILLVDEQVLKRTKKEATFRIIKKCREMEKMFANKTLNPQR